MGFQIKSGQGAVVAKGGLVKKGLAVGRLAHVTEKDSKYEDKYGNMKKNFEWEVELFNPNGDNAWVRVWTNQTLHPKGGLYPFVDAIFDGVPDDGIESTDDLIGKPFLLRVVDDFAIESEDGVIYVNRPHKPKDGGKYTIMPFEGDDPFVNSAEDAYLAATADDDEFGDDDDDGDIPF